ncbi:MAG: hypothetical protein IJ605_05255 [Prevotella sp.]|nr:hypothetical protein [Prevotella sp.]
MERSTIIFILSMVVSSLIGYAVKLFLDKNDAKNEPEPKRSRPRSAQKSVDELIAQFGEPDDIILLDATRGNEAEGIILVYDSAGIFIINGEKIRKTDITDVTFNNNAVPYVPNDYQVVVTTNDNEKPPICLHVGNDANWTLQVVGQIKHHWEKTT